MILDYDNTCESIGIRVRDGDHLVKEAIKEYKTCKTWHGVAQWALILRDKAVREEKFLVALIHDTIAADAQREVENA